jgi:lysozyme
MPTPQRIHRQISPAGLDAIKQREGLRLKAYQDQAGVWTIGYGHTGDVWEGNGQIDEAKAEALLKEDVRWAETTISANVQVALDDYEFAALVSWAFNVGTHNVIESTLVRRLNAGEYEAVPSELMRWIKITDPETGELVASQGLVNRRSMEVSQWHQGIGQPDLDTQPPAGPIVPIQHGREDITKSRTMRGGAVAGAGTLAGSIMDAVEQVKPQLAETMTFLPAMKWVFVALVLVGIGAVIYARLDDHRKGSM